jgi:hypothetical protein
VTIPGGIRELIEKGSLPASQCGMAFLKLLSPLLDSAVLEWKRSGAGRQLSVRNAGALRDFCCECFPETKFPTDIESRIAGVGRFRDSKALSSTGNEIISIRAWRDDALLKNGQSAGTAAATAAHGVFSFLLTNSGQYRLNGRCLLVENPAVFTAVERLGVAVDAVIYGQGRISNRAMDWMARRADSNFSLLHLPDYDPVGLSEFGRLKLRLGERVALYLPADLEIRFERFSNRELLKRVNSQAMLAQLRRSESPAVRRVVELIDRHNAGLEQEALLIPLRSRECAYRL